jgi:hypothetical protein
VTPAGTMNLAAGLKVLIKLFNGNPSFRMDVGYGGGGGAMSCEEILFLKLHMADFL